MPSDVINRQASDDAVCSFSTRRCACWGILYSNVVVGAAPSKRANKAAVSRIEALEIIADYPDALACCRRICRTNSSGYDQRRTTRLFSEIFWCKPPAGGGEGRCRVVDIVARRRSSVLCVSETGPLRMKTKPIIENMNEFRITQTVTRAGP